MEKVEIKGDSVPQEIVDMLGQEVGPDLFREYDFNISTKDRTIYLRDEIDIFTPTFLKKRINLIAGLTDDDKTPITIEVSSYGGDVYGAMGSVDIIRSAPMKINVTGIGVIMSAASFILVSGTGTRAITENSHIMIHDINGWIKGNSKDIISESAQMKKLQDKCHIIYAKYTKHPVSYWKEKTKSNLYLNARQAFKAGMIDKVQKTWKIN
ncbi:ATP-dependent Clp protease proteolytic subunit [bacterium]|nr:ATP-dependent Clp protease proteolytic subunit [bacterium]